jgi:CobQ-like glutamine amidotransferase family enzyme/UDP-N-acetylmuramyl tripeptide synthase
LKLDPRFVERAAARFPLRVVITGTNGKTSTMTLLRHLLEADGRRVVANEEGANLHQGIAAALLEGPGDALVMEVDEAAFPKLAPALAPQLVIVTGLFRDQLDRFGEVRTTRAHLERAIASLPDARLLLNGDDPLVASLALPGRSLAFRAALPAMEVPSDIPACPVCGGELDYGERYYAHLGRYRCESCGFTNPDTRFEATFDGAGLTLDGRTFPPLPPYLHPYSATAALAAAMELGVEPRLEVWPGTVGGRGEVRTIEGRRVSLALVKNPASMSWNLAQEHVDGHVFLINDGSADGVDVSWLWDARYPADLGRVTVGGSRALEFLIRMRYLDPRPAAAAYTTLHDALTVAVREAPGDGSVLVLSTYTNLKQARQSLDRALAPAPGPGLALPDGEAGAAPPPVRTGPNGRPARIAWLYPDQMGTYGDGGNLEVLRRRLAWRGRTAEVVRVDVGDDWPRDVDAVVMGGGEDLAQGLIMSDLRRHAGELGALLDDGAAALVVCGGYQLLGESFEVDGRPVDGLGLLPVTTSRGSPRLVGRMLVESPFVPQLLVGFENHGGHTRLAGGKPLGRVVQGHGNAFEGAADEGVVHGHAIGTYLHGPVLARNPWLADLLLGWIAERRGWDALAPLDDGIELRALERFSASARTR